MKIKFNWSYFDGEIDTDTAQMVDLPARKSKGEKSADIALKPTPKSLNYGIAEITTGDRESSNKLAKEIARRWNEYGKCEWKEIPTDMEGWGKYSDIPSNSVIVYRDGTMFNASGTDLLDWAGDIERHPQRFRYIELPLINFE